MVESFVRPVARSSHRSFAEAEIAARCIGSPVYFASHAWERLFVELVEGLIGDLEGAALDDAYVWLDIFAINQDDTGGVFSAMDELNDGRTLACVIELSRAAKVVLDKLEVYALTRLWCLYLLRGIHMAQKFTNLQLVDFCANLQLVYFVTNLLPGQV